MQYTPFHAERTVVRMVIPDSFDRRTTACASVPSVTIPLHQGNPNGVNLTQKFNHQDKTTHLRQSAIYLSLYHLNYQFSF